MTITSSLRFLYIFGGSGLLCARAEAGEFMALLAIVIGLCTHLGIVLLQGVNKYSDLTFLVHKILEFEAKVVIFSL